MPIDLESTYEQDVFYNIELWSNDNNIMFITGISGSGKSTLAEALALEIGAKTICLDSFTLNQPLNGTAGAYMELYKRTYPEIQIVETSTSQGDFATPGLCHFLKFLIPTLKNNQTSLFVVEGCHLLDLDQTMIQELSIAKQPLIIKRTSNKRYADMRRHKNPNVADKDIWGSIVRNDTIIRQFQQRLRVE